MGIDKIISVSLENISSIQVVLDPDIKDTEKIKRDIRDSVGRVTDFPDAVTDTPLITELDTSMMQIIDIGITGDIPYNELRDIAKYFEDKLLELSGISRIEKVGYRAREIKVEVGPRYMDRFQIPLREIIGAIQSRNIRSTGGTFESYTSEKNVVTLAQFTDPMEVGDVVIRSTFNGPLIKVHDLAIITDDFEDESILAGVDGEKSISLVVYKTENADIIRTIDSIKNLLQKESEKKASLLNDDEIGIEVNEVTSETEVENADESLEGESELGLLEQINQFIFGEEEEPIKTFEYGPATIHLTDDRSILVNKRFQITLTNGLIGLLLVLIVLSIFLNFRIAFWVAMGIPISIMGVCFMLPAFNGFLDSITLTAMVLMIGIIVDDGIIVSENITRRRELGDTPLQAAVNGVKEVFFPVLTTVLTTFLVFAPMFAITGMMGKFVIVIPLTVSLALFFSLFESIVALPAHIVKGMKKSKKPAGRALMARFFEFLKKGYKKVVYYFLVVRHVLVVLFIVAFILVISFAAENMKFILFPSKGAERFIISIELAQGSSLDATLEKVREVEALLTDLPEEELDTYLDRIGQGLQAVGENYAFIGVNLTPYSERTRDADMIVEELRQKIDEIDGIEKFFFNIDTGGPGVGKPVSIMVIGNDNTTRKELTTEVTDLLNSINGVKDVDRNDKDGKEQIEIKINYDALARLGLTVEDIAQNVRIAFDGQTVTSFRDGDEDVNFRVQLQEYARKNVAYLYDLSIPNNQGRLIKLSEVAYLESGPGPNAFHHYQGVRTTTIEADLDQDIITPIEVSDIILSGFNLEKNWPGMQIITGGEAEESSTSLVSLMTTFIIAFVGIYFLLVLLFKSYTQPFLVIAAIPFGIIGVILALNAHGEHLSFLGIMGIIGMMGVVVNDSLVLVNHLNELKKEKPDANIRELVAEGTANRLRAIILTTITTVVGLLPLAYGFGGTDLYMQPMALTLGYGLLFATPLTLILVPCLYTIFNDIAVLKNKIKGLFISIFGKKIKTEKITK